MWQASEEIRMAKTETYVYMTSEGINIKTSPPYAHQINTIIEATMGSILHLTNRYLAISLERKEKS